MRRTTQQWLTLFEIQRESHLSVKQFCLEQGISPSNFYKKKAVVAPVTSIAAREAREATVMISPFSQVHLAMPELKNTNPLRDIKLNIGNIELTLDSKTEVNWLVNLMGQLA
jgi:ACT domain-containing protein